MENPIKTDDYLDELDDLDDLGAFRGTPIETSNCFQSWETIIRPLWLRKAPGQGEVLRRGKYNCDNLST